MLFQFPKIRVTRAISLTQPYTNSVSDFPLKTRVTRAGLERWRRRCLVANRATLTQMWPRPPRNVAESCELTETTKPGLGPTP